MKKQAKKKAVKKIKHTELKIELVPIDSVHLLPGNPRKNDKSSEKLAKKIKIYGQRTPLVVWGKDMAIYKGNTTWKAMKLLGYKEINVIFHDFKSERQAIAYSLADNKASEDSDWDPNLLALIMQTEEYEFTSEETGFSDKELTAYRLSTTESPQELLDLGIQGALPGKNDFGILQFDSREDRQAFKAKLGIKDDKERVIHINTLMKHMNFIKLVPDDKSGLPKKKKATKKKVKK